jgi:hypothetical protein
LCWVFLRQDLQTVCLGWLQTSILLISVFQVTKVIGMSPQHPDEMRIFQKYWFLISSPRVSNVTVLLVYYEVLSMILMQSVWDLTIRGLKTLFQQEEML